MIESIPLGGAFQIVIFAWKKLRARFFPRKPLDAITLLRDHVELGHEVLLVNTSDEPILIFEYDIVDAARAGDEEKNFEYVVRLEDDLLNIRLEPKQAYRFGFSEGEFFPLTPKNGNYFMRVWMHGHKEPVWVKL